MAPLSFTVRCRGSERLSSAGRAALRVRMLVSTPVARRAMCTGETRNAVRRAGAPVIVEGASSVQRYLEASILLAWAEMTWLRRVFGR